PTTSVRRNLFRKYSYELLRLHHLRHGGHRSRSLHVRRLWPRRATVGHCCSPDPAPTGMASHPDRSRHLPRLLGEGPPVNLRRFAIALPAGMALLNANQRLHYRVRAERVEALRGAAMAGCSEDPAMRAALATAGDGPLLKRAYILGIVHPQKNHRFDP